MATAERIVALQVGIAPEAAVSGAGLIQTEYSAFLIFNATRPTKRKSPSGGFYREDAGIAVVQFSRCTATKFGYPNDEAWDGIPRTKGLSYGIYEVENSEWKQEMARLNQYSFPATKDWAGRHFLFLFHDSSFECLADEMKIEVTKEPHAKVVASVLERLKW